MKSVFCFLSATDLSHDLKKIILIILLFSVLLIAGCQSTFTGNFREFSKGLKMFLCNAVKTSIMKTKSHLAFSEEAV